MESAAHGGKLTDTNYTHLLAILDRSGSMAGVKDDMESGLNELFKEQAKLDGKCLVDYVQFDDQYELVFQDTPVGDAKAVLQPRGLTALLDAVGKSVTQLGDKLAKLDEDKRPGLVQVIVVTDGYENASREWNAEKVRALIKQQTDEWNWDFVFLGANLDAVVVGTSFGFDAGKSMTYDTGNTGALYASASSYVTRSRTVGAGSNTFSDEDREAQKA